MQLGFVFNIGESIWLVSFLGYKEYKPYLTSLFPLSDVGFWGPRIVSSFGCGFWGLGLFGVSDFGLGVSAFRFRFTDFGFTEGLGFGCQSSRV